MPARIGKYTGLELIGQGATASVYLAQHPDLRQPRAIKVFETGRTVDSKGLLPEAVHQAGLSHRRILQVYDQEIDPQTGKLFLVMEYAPGGSLRALLDKEGPLEPAQALELAAQVADGLAEAHEAGISHLDIKPENILLRVPGDAVISDFGLAVALESCPEGHPGGTPNYMPPEQIQGSYGLSCDVWALGAMLYEMLTGRLCFEGEDRDTIVQAVLSGPGDIAARMRHCGLTTTSGVSNLLHRMLEMDPARRIDADQARRELEVLNRQSGGQDEEGGKKVSQGLPTEAPQWRCKKCGGDAPWGMDICMECAREEMPRITLNEKTAKPRQNRKVLAMAACAILVLIGTMAAGAYIWQEQPPKPGSIALVEQAPTPAATQTTAAQQVAAPETPQSAPVAASDTPQVPSTAVHKEMATARPPLPRPTRVAKPITPPRVKALAVPKRTAIAAPARAVIEPRTAKSAPIAKAEPASAVAPGNNAIFKAMSGQGGRAEGVLREKLRAQPGHTGSSRNLALLLVEQKRYKEALGILSKLVRKHPGDAEAAQAMEITRRLLASGRP